jgi:CubicO group peptidase (beta-lactamase class C family)
VAGVSEVKPETVGFSSKRLERLDALMQWMIDEQQFAGIVTLAARHGKIFQSKTYGLKDMASAASMRKDTIFRIYSMSKPVISVAMMILYEEGKWNPQDPISKYIPEFANLKVFKGFDRFGKMILEDPAHPPLMRELMSHTAGFGYGFSADAADKLYQDENGYNAILGAPSPEEMITRLSKIPLLYQPGTRWEYSVSVDIQGYLVKQLSGESLPEFLKARIFDPPGMIDTGFYVPQTKRSRFATLYKRTDKGELAIVDPDFVAYGLDPKIPAYNLDKNPAMPLGGTGLVSTAADYMKFAQMLLNGGQLGGARILGPETVKMMSGNHLSQTLMTGERGDGIYRIRPGFGFGFDVGVYTDPTLADDPCGKGTYLWDGAAGTWFWVDPTNDIVFVGMTQAFNILPGDLARQAVYQALLEEKP